MDLTGVDRHGFTGAEAADRTRVWRELARYLQRYVSPQSVVLDVGCDRGDFIRNIVAQEKWATDLRDVSGHLPPEVRFVRTNGLDLAALLPLGHFDAVFMSNFLEHLPSREAVIEQLRVTHALLKPGGRVIILQPNIRLIGGAYWDFIDHRVPLTDRSLVQGALLAGFRTRVCVPRFLPYTLKSPLPKHPLLVRAYLSLRPLWWLMGKQTLYVGEKE